MIKPKLSYANVVATLALVFAMTGSAVAAHHYLITSTKQISPKVISTLKGKAGKTGPIGPQGLPGKEGAVGKEGKEGTSATKLFAVVESGGTLVSNNSSGAISATPSGTGVVIVKFDQNITKCAFLGTIGATGFVSTDSGIISVQGANTTTDSLYVETLNTAGVAANKSFTVAVFC
ncbi:MAG TPA: hypothetical protein VFR48_02740 [Solirubrobacteraceae bacterium]|nr:hypothetical protein [Solirubrobacteraceae bacterium]